MGIIRDTAKAVYSAGPAGSPDQPDKDEIIGLNGVIEDSVSGAAAGMVRSTTLGGLGSGTRVGQPGQVTAGVDKGEYLWSGSAWVRTGDLIDAIALQSGITANTTDITTLKTSKQDVPASMTLSTFAGHNIAYTLTYGDLKPMLSFTEEGIPFDHYRHSLSTDAQYSAVYSYGDSNILAIGFKRNGKRPYIRGIEAPCDFPDILHFAIYGQSNAGGADANPVVSGADQGIGNYKPVQGIQTWNFIYGPSFSGIAGRGIAQWDLVPQYEQNHQNGQGEFFTTGMTGQFKLMSVGGRYNMGSLEESKPHIVTSSASTGGIYLSALLPADPEAKGYYNVWKDDISKAKAQADRMGMTYGFAGTVWCQGESEASSLKLTPAGSVQPFLTVQNTWSDNVIALRAAMEADRNSILSTTGPMPLWAVAGRYPLIGNALKRAASLDPHIILCTPLHFAPNAMNSQLTPSLDPAGRKYGDVLHMTADGNRWVGEYIGKTEAQVLKLGRRPKVLMTKDIWRVDDHTIRVQFDVPYKPLRIDDVYTFPVQNMGLRVFAGTLNAVGSQAVITNTAIVGDDTIEITLSTTIATGSSFMVEYLGEKIGSTSTALLESVQDGAAYANGNATKEYVFNGDVRDQFLPSLRNGLFYLFQDGVSFNPTVRDIRFSGGKTILRGDASAYVATQNLGAVVRISAPFATGSICDSDPALSVYKFTDTTYGSNAGKYYPLHNYAFPFIEAVRT